MTNFAQVANNAVTTLASGRSSGASTLTVATGTGSLFPTPTPTNPVKLTLVTSATRGTTSETLTILQATGRSGDTFSGLTVIEGSTDRAYSAGDYVELRLTAGHVSAIHSAVNTAETAVALAALDSAVVHVAGTETITGAKTFSTAPVLASLSGLLKGSSGSLSAALADVDYLTPGTAASAYSPIAGSASITTVGTIASGTWSGSTIAVAKGGTGLTSLGTAYQLLGVNSGATGYQATSIAGGTGISVTTATNTITVALGNHDAGLITTGTMGTARLGSGSATSSTYLRGDSTWATPTASVAIGSAVSSGTAGSVLFVDAGGNLGQANSSLLWDTVNAALSVTSSTVNQVPLTVKNSAASGKSRLRIDAGSNANSGFFLASGGVNKFEIANVVSGGTNFSYFVYNLQTSRYALTVQGDKDRIGIGGLTAPSAQLHVQATDTTTPTAIFQAVASQGASTYVVDVRDASGLTVGYFDRSGNVYTAGTLKITNYSTMGGTYWNYSSAGAGCVIQAGVGSYLLASGTPAITLGASGETIIPGTVSTGTWTGISIPHVFSTSGAQTWSSTVDVAGVRMTQGFGGGSLTHTSTTPLTALLVAPTFNLASGSTGRCVPLRVNPTYTAVGTGMIPVSILVQDGGTDRWGVDRYGRMVGASPAPSIAAGTGAGTSPTVSVASQTDQAGVISVTTGTTPSASADVATITFSNAFATAPKAVILTPANAATAALSGNAAVFVDSANITTTTFKITVGSTNLTGSTAYKWFYLVL